LKHKINRRALTKRGKLRSDMSKDTALCRNRVPSRTESISFQQPSRAGTLSATGYADHRIARSQQGKPSIMAAAIRSDHPWMVRLKP